MKIDTILLILKALRIYGRSVIAVKEREKELSLLFYLMLHTLWQIQVKE